MKTKIEKQQDNRVKISIDVAQERVKTAFDQAYKRIGQDAKVPGFRPGKVPRDILEQRYSKLAHNQALEDLIPAIYKEVIEKEKILVINAPEITDVKLTPQSLSFNASVEIKPKINLRQYKKLRIKYKRPNITSQDLDKAKDDLKKERKIEIIDDNFVKGLGFISLKDFEASLEKQIYLQKESQNRLDLENQIIEQLKKNTDFKLPQTLVNRRLEELMANARQELATRFGYTKEQIQQQEPKLRENFVNHAEEQVRVYLIFEEIANRENIKIDDSVSRNVIELLLKNAVWEEG